MGDKPQANGCAFILLFIALLVVILALFPALVFVYPFSNSLQEAIETTSESIWAWLWSAAVWGSLYLAFRKKD